jgi:hypothetical protein
MCNKPFLEEENVSGTLFTKKQKRKHVFSVCVRLRYSFLKKKDGHNNKRRESFPFISLF